MTIPDDMIESIEDITPKKETESQILYSLFGGKKPRNIPKTEIKIKFCDLCDGFYVECPKCGNNSCNAGYGLDGKCDVCVHMYSIMYALNKQIGLRDEIDEILLTEFKDGKSSTPLKSSYSCSKCKHVHANRKECGDCMRDDYSHWEGKE